MTIINKILPIHSLALLLVGLLPLNLISSHGDGVDGLIRARSSGSISLLLQITDSGEITIDPEYPAGIRPEFVIERLALPPYRQGQPDFALCIIGTDARQYRIDTVLLNDDGNLQRTSEAPASPYVITAGSTESKASRVYLRAVTKAQCSQKTALKVFLNKGDPGFKTSVELRDKFKLLLKAE